MTILPHRDLANARKAASLLGLGLDGECLEGAVVRRNNGALEAVRAFRAPLAIDPLTYEPELVGREILDHLEAAGIRERRCVVAVPLRWALTAQVKLPDLPEADLTSFIQIEAERSFPCDVATLRLSTSRYVAPSGESWATIVGIPVSHLERLEQALLAAKVKPVSFGLGIAALQPPGAEPSRGVLALVIGADQIDLQITCGGGVALLRVLDGVLETEGGERILHGDLVAREVRITRGQLSSELRDAVQCIRIFGPPELARQLGAELRPRFQAAGVAVELAAQASAGGAAVLPDPAACGGISLAAGQLLGRQSPFEFLAPRVSFWKRMLARHVSGRLQMVGAVAAAAVVLVGAAFAVQQWQLARLGSRWTAMAPAVRDADQAQQMIRRFRAWDHDSFRCLDILRTVSSVFPEDGAVTLKTLEVREVRTVSCSGTARDNAVLLRTLGQLRSAANVHDVRVVQIRGGSPIQFTFEFQYGEQVAREN